MDLRAALFTLAVMLARRFRQVRRRREAVRPAPVPSLQQQSQPFRTALWLYLLYPPETWKEIQNPHEGWRVHVNV